MPRRLEHYLILKQHPEFACAAKEKKHLGEPITDPREHSIENDIMVLTDRQRQDLHAGIYEYLVSHGETFEAAAKAFAEADPKATEKKTNNVGKTPLLEKKWTAIPRLQKKVLELERVVAQSAKIHAHRAGGEDGGKANGVSRRMLPRLPCSHTLTGHSAPVTCLKVHPVFTVVVSGSEDGSIKVSR